MQNLWYRERKRIDFRIEFGAVVCEHLIAAVHHANGGFEYRAAGIFKPFTRLQMGLLANDTFAANLQFLTLGVRDDPVAGQQFRGNRAGIQYSHGIGEHVAIALHARLCLQVGRVYMNLNFVVVSFVHGSILYA